MEHVLDNPAWSALISNNKPFANGDESVKYFDKEVSPFVALSKNSEDNFRLLYELLPHNGPVLLISPGEIQIPADWKVLHCIKGRQMICENELVNEESSAAKLTPLTKQHVPQMRELTKMTNPGPFEERTIELGHYFGIFEEDKLVAMAGQRLHAFQYAEISAVCTHPDCTGKGYARQLLISHINRIKAASQVPFLHVKYDNARAIKVYESLGFVTRREIYFYFMKKNGELSR